MPAGANQITIGNLRIIPVGNVFINLAAASVVSLSNFIPANTAPDICIIQAQGGGVYWRDDGNGPSDTAGGGLYIAENQVIQYNPENLTLTNFRAIIENGKTGFLAVSFYNFGAV